MHWKYCTKEFEEACQGNGCVPRVHGNVGRKPHNALKYEQVKVVAQFIKAHTEKYGIPHPAPLRGRDGTPPTFLPASQGYRSVHKIYLESCTEHGVKAVGYDSFHFVWHACFLHYVFMTPRMDVC